MTGGANTLSELKWLDKTEGYCDLMVLAWFWLYQFRTDSFRNALSVDFVVLPSTIKDQSPSVCRHTHISSQRIQVITASAGSF